MATDANEFKTYFFDKFTILFKELLIYSIEHVKSENSKKELEKVKDLSEKLNYEKIITKLTTKTQIHEKIVFLHRNEYKKEFMDSILKNDKDFVLIPSFNIATILLSISPNRYSEFYEKIDKLFLCVNSYNQINISLSTQKDSDTFNPFVGIGSDKVQENMDVSTMFNGVKTEQFSAYEMIVKSLVEQQMDGKMTDYMNNINEKDVDTAAGKITNVLDSDKFKGDGQTTDILKNMLGKIKKEVIGLGGEKNNNGKQGVEKLLGIAQSVAQDMVGDIKSNKVSVIDLWDATAKLAENTTNSTAFQVLNKIVRSNIEKNVNAETEAQRPQSASEPAAEPTPKSKTKISKRK